MNLTPAGEKLTDAKLLDLVGEFNAKMVRIMNSVGYIQKDATMEGGSFSYKYASAARVLGKVRDECVKESISVESGSEIVEFHIVGTKSLAVVQTTLFFTDGIFMAHATGLGSGIDSGDKAVMKADTAAIKYACSGKFLISWGDDPEAESEDPEEETQREAIASWQVTAGTACTSVDAAKEWWEASKGDIKAECGEAGASEVYKTFVVYYERLKAEAADASD